MKEHKEWQRLMDSNNMEISRCTVLQEKMLREKQHEHPHKQRHKSSYSRHNRTSRNTAHANNESVWNKNSSRSNSWKSRNKNRNYPRIQQDRKSTRLNSS